MIAMVLLGIFIAAMIAIGVWGMRQTKSLNDFFLGGRNIGPWMSAFAYGTTYFSAVLFIGFAGNLGWRFGMPALWVALGNTVAGALLSWLLLGRRTRRMTQNLQAMTMPEFFHERYDARFLKLFSALIIFVFLVPYSASVFTGLAHLFTANFNISYDFALALMIAITGVYLVLGGYFAVAMTDFIQGLIMLVGSFVMIGIMIAKAGGLSHAIQTVAERYPVHAAQLPPNLQPTWWALASLIFMTSFGVWALPQMVQKFYAIKDEKMILRAAIVTTFFAAVITVAAYFNGVLTHVFYDTNTLPLASNGKVAFDQMIPGLLKAHLPEFVMAVILLLVLSASMSTLASLVLVSSSAVAIDLYQGHINPNMSKKGALALMRGLSTLFIVISYVVAKFQLGIIVTLMSLSWGVVAGAFMAPYLYGLYWKRTTLAGVYAGMLTGMTAAIVLFYKLPGNSATAASIAMLLPFIVVPAVSLLTTPPKPEIIQRAFAGISEQPPTPASQPEPVGA